MDIECSPQLAERIIVMIDAQVDAHFAPLPGGWNDEDRCRHPPPGVPPASCLRARAARGEPTGPLLWLRTRHPLPLAPRVPPSCSPRSGSPRPPPRRRRERRHHQWSRPPPRRRKASRLGAWPPPGQLRPAARRPQLRPIPCAASVEHACAPVCASRPTIDAIISVMPPRCLTPKPVQCEPNMYRALTHARHVPDSTCPDRTTCSALLARDPGNRLSAAKEMPSLRRQPAPPPAFSRHSRDGLALLRDLVPSEQESSTERVRSLRTLRVREAVAQSVARRGSLCAPHQDRRE